MATMFKQLTNEDVVHTKGLLYEAVPLTGTLISGSYSGTNIKNPAHGMYQEVWDYNYASSSANHLFDITLGYASGSPRQNTADTLYDKKRNIYDQMAQVAVGYDATGSILNFDADGNLIAGGDKITGSYFLTFSRLLVKDEIKKGTFNMYLALSGTWASARSGTYGNVLITDSGSQTNYFVNSPVGEYGILKSGSTGVGLIYYQAGLVVLNAELIFMSSSVNGGSDVDLDSSGNHVDYFQSSGSITGSADGLRYRINNITFSNTIELNTQLVFCRLNHNDFNYSANPTYLSGSQIRVKNVTSDSPVSYFTTVGLYSADNELLAVGKFSTPLKKDPTIEMILRTRVDY